MKKTYNLPPRLVARVKRILEARTETEAIVRCMEQVAYMDDVGKMLGDVGGALPDYQPLR